MRLATKYRPATFDEVSGQKATIACLRGMAERRDVPSALLFFGAFGSGKTTSARILAAALNCEAESRPCGACPSCKAIAAGNSLDVHEVDAASNGTVEKVREICDLVQYGPAGHWRVVIFDEAQSMSRDAVNHLLKTLEEPPPYVVFVLVTTERGKLLPTAPSRCIPFAFTRLPAAAVAARLRQVADAEHIDVEDELLAHLAAKANGAMRDALNYLEQASILKIRTLAGWRELNSELDFAPALLSAAVSGSHARLYAELDTALLTCSDYSELVRQLCFCLRDILVLVSGGRVEHQGEALAARRSLAEEIGAARAVKAMGVLWELQTKFRAEDRIAGLNNAVVMLAERLGATRQPPPGSNGHDQLVTQADLAKLEEFTL